MPFFKDKKGLAGSLQKTIGYVKRNGIQKTWYAVRERLAEKKKPPYCFLPPSKESLQKQQMRIWENPITFSILVPAYETNALYFRELLQSMREQTYPYWELVVADASKSEVVKRQIDMVSDDRIKYKRLSENAGISENSNQALSQATGVFTGLLDHDDLLTPDALYEMADFIANMEKNGTPVDVVYSDEDKMDETGTTFFEPYYKGAFNYDLFLSNNYMCHFTVMRTTLLQKLGFRKAYDGAQDYDLFLRALATCGRRKIGYIGKVLYHWRCHTGSTAQNPESKRYAYEAGKSALKDFCQSQGMCGEIVDTPHLGFYQFLPEVAVGSEFTEKEAIAEAIFQMREDVIGIGGHYYRNGKIVGGALNVDGSVCYENLSQFYSGYMHRAILSQNVYALDLDSCIIRSEWKEKYLEILKLFGISKQSNIEVKRKAALAFAAEVEKAGGLLLLRTDCSQYQ